MFLFLSNICSFASSKGEGSRRAWIPDYAVVLWRSDYGWSMGSCSDGGPLQFSTFTLLHFKCSNLITCKLVWECAPSGQARTWADGAIHLVQILFSIFLEFTIDKKTVICLHLQDVEVIPSLSWVYISRKALFSLRRVSEYWKKTSLFESKQRRSSARFRVKYACWGRRAFSGSVL